MGKGRAKITAGVDRWDKANHTVMTRLRSTIVWFNQQSALPRDRTWDSVALLVGRD